MLTETSKTSTATLDDLVVVVHGFAGKRVWMYPMCWRFRARGYRVCNWGYTSVCGSIEKHAKSFYEHLAVSLAGERRIHIVAHSMGAIVVRSALAMGTLDNLGRVVLFAPPNHGSPVARHAERLVGGTWKMIAELSDRSDSFVNGLPATCPAEVGIVAAKYDLLVPVASTHLTCEREHQVLNATHNSILLTSNAVDLACSFLATGRFEQN